MGTDGSLKGLETLGKGIETVGKYREVGKGFFPWQQKISGRAEVLGFKFRGKFFLDRWIYLSKRKN